MTLHIPFTPAQAAGAYYTAKAEDALRRLAQARYDELYQAALQARRRHIAACRQELIDLVPPEDPCRPVALCLAAHFGIGRESDGYPARFLTGGGSIFIQAAKILCDGQHPGDKRRGGLLRLLGRGSWSTDLEPLAAQEQSLDCDAWRALTTYVETVGIGTTVIPVLRS